MALHVTTGTSTAIRLPEQRKVLLVREERRPLRDPAGERGVLTPKRGKRGERCR